MKKSKIAVKDLKARKDVKGGTAKPQNQYLNQGNQTSSFGNQYTSSSNNQYLSSGNQTTSSTTSY